MNRNNVRGPTSALTEFLRASGITPTTVARRAQTRNQPQQNTNENENQAGPSHDVGTNGLEGGEDIDAAPIEDDAPTQDETGSSIRRRRTRATTVTGYTSDHLDDSDPADPEAEPLTSKRKKLNMATQAKFRAKLKAKAKKQAEKENGKNKEKGKGKKAGSGDDDDEEEDTYTALSKSLWTGSSRPPVGSFENCAKCGKQFTVTKYTMAAIPGPGFLCHPCAKSSGADPFSNTNNKPIAKKRKDPAEKRNVVNFEENRFPSLVSLCIKIVSQNIDDVEALGDIGAVNMEEISKAISKNRSLTPENAQLFYGAHNMRLTLYDATKLTTPAFTTLAKLNPNLTFLRLDFCGRIDDAALQSWCTSLPHLTHLELLGPFLIRPPAWAAFFSSHPALDAFLITQSPRFDLTCVQSLVENCPELKQVRLREVEKLDDGFVGVLKKLRRLEVLDLGEPAESCSEEALTELMQAVGGTLTSLDLTGHTVLTDDFLERGLKENMKVLTSLTLVGLPGLTDEGVGRFFDGWTRNPGLLYVDLSRSHELGDRALSGVLHHSGATIQSLFISGWGSVDSVTFGEIPKVGRELQKLDVGWCRAVDDFWMKDLLEGCGKLKWVKVWGCNKVSERCPRKRGVPIYGVESHSVL